MNTQEADLAPAVSLGMNWLYSTVVVIEMWSEWWMKQPMDVTSDAR